jgi:hypothetical protein
MLEPCVCCTHVLRRTGLNHHSQHLALCVVLCGTELAGSGVAGELVALVVDGLRNCSVPEGAVALQLPSPQTTKLVGGMEFSGVPPPPDGVLCAGRGLSPGQHPAVAKSMWCLIVYACVPTQLLTHHTQTTYYMLDRHLSHLTCPTSFDASSCHHLTQ